MGNAAIMALHKRRDGTECGNYHSIFLASNRQSASQGGRLETCRMLLEPGTTGGRTGRFSPVSIDHGHVGYARTTGARVKSSKSAIPAKAFIDTQKTC